MDKHTYTIGCLSLSAVVLLVGLTLGVGWLVSRLGYAGNCRNTNFLRVVGLVCGLVALYVSWAAFESEPTSMSLKAILFFLRNSFVFIHQGQLFVLYIFTLIFIPPYLNLLTIVNFIYVTETLFTLMKGVL